MINSVDASTSNYNISTSVRDSSVATIYTQPTLNKIIKDNADFNKKSQKANFIQKILTFPTLSLVPIIPLVAGDIYYGIKSHKLKKLATKSEENKKVFIEFKKKMPKKLLLLASLIIPIGIAMNYINNKTKDKHLKKAQLQIEKYNQKNYTEIKISSKPMPSCFIGALFSPVSGQIVLGSTFCEDSIYAKTHQKHMINHELTHAGQYMLMARSDNGIEKLNYIALKKIASTLSPEGRNEIYNSYQEIKNGATDTYKNKTLSQMGYEINLVDYITGLYKIIYEKDTKSNDVPIIINKDFYQKTIDKKGKLSKAEEAKAQKYFEAYANYPNKLGFAEAYNPWSKYRNNLLEKEAYKANPWYTM